jgi:uncharacterized repeat protein (TIGR02543 family)
MVASILKNILEICNNAQKGKRMSVITKRTKWLCWVVAVALLLTVAVTLPFAAGTAEKAYADTEYTSGDYKYTLSEGNATITGYKGDGGAVIIPSIITEGAVGYPVTAIGDGAFSSVDSLTSVTIQSGVISIGYGAFRICSSLEYVSIPDSVASIGKRAFYCSFSHENFSDTIVSLKQIDVDAQNANYSSVDGVLFSRDKTKLIVYPPKKAGAAYEVPDSVTDIDDNAFANALTLASLTIPSGVEAIGNYAFAHCGLTSCILPDSVSSIGDAAFAFCPYLTSIVIPDSVVSIGEWAFSYCISLTAATIPNSVTSMEDNAFSGCERLRFKVYSGSYAQTYADRNHIPYDLIGVSYTVTFDVNGGAVSPDAKTINASRPGNPVGALPASPSRSGYTFKGWFTAPSGGAQITASTPITANVTYYAHWEAVAPQSKEVGEAPPAKEVTPPKGEAPLAQFIVTLNANGGSVSQKSVTINDGAKVGALPTPKRTGYDFKGWYTAKSGGTKISEDTPVKANVTWYAHWAAKSYKATFDANKGKVSGKAKFAKSVKYDTKLGKLPTPKRKGYKFKGWYTKKSGGAKITASTEMPAKNVTYYAQWKKK